MLLCMTFYDCKITSPMVDSQFATVELDPVALIVDSLQMCCSGISSVANYIHKSPLGILIPRIGGNCHTWDNKKIKYDTQISFAVI